jgi:hypothetical protein
MGAIFNSVVYEKDDRAAIQKEWNASVEQSLYDSGFAYSGEIGMLAGDIKWQDKKLETAAQAEEYLEDHHEKWEPAMAVSFLKDGAKHWMVGGWCSS